MTERQITGPRATVEYAHDDVQFAKALDEAAYFVQENLAWGSWFRIPKADYDAAIARCRADPTTQLIVCNKQTHDGQVNMTFWPSATDLQAFESTTDLIEPPPEHYAASVLTTPILGGYVKLDLGEAA